MSSAATDSEARLAEDVASFYDDPEGFVRYIYPWGEGPLRGEDGPDVWQSDVMALIRDSIRLGHPVGLAVEGALRIAVRSGHGIGKTTLISWIIHWFCSTRTHPQIVCTANTRIQLEVKTWRELAKWHKLALNKHWFDWTATKFSLVEHASTWFASAIPWSKERSEAFAGTHEENVLMIFDEASNIPDSIWEVSEGAMTTPGAIWIVFGNPTRNTGRFSSCFKKDRNRWLTMEIDSRNCKKTNKKEIAAQIEEYGEDSDFVRVRIKGQEPRQGLRQLIGDELVETAMGRVLRPEVYAHAAIVLGVDVARMPGADDNVIAIRQGLAAFEQRRFQGSGDGWLMNFASLVARFIEDYSPDAVFVDVVGIGAGVVDRLIQLGFGQIVIPVNFAEEAANPNRYHNLRAECYCKMEQWLKAGGALPNDKRLRDDLTGPEYLFDAKDRWQIERKEDMRSRGLASPDGADALAVTFAEEVLPRQVKIARAESTRQQQSAYHPLARRHGSKVLDKTANRERLGIIFGGR